MVESKTDFACDEKHIEIYKIKRLIYKLDNVKG